MLIQWEREKHALLALDYQTGTSLCGEYMKQLSWLLWPAEGCGVSGGGHERVYF